MKKNTNILVTTTSSFENANIEKYYDLVSTNVVVGTNFFSDFSASFTDLFGGNSGTYQKKLQKIYDKAIFNLKEQLSDTDANAIIGLKIDFDEISGKGKSMFMVSAVGTPVKINLKEEYFEDNKNNLSLISNEKLNNEIKKRMIIMDLRNGKIPSEENWNFLFDNPIVEITEELINIYLEEDVFKEQSIIDNVPNYLKLIDENIVIDILYQKLEREENKTTSPSFYKNSVYFLIKKNNLFSPNKIIGLINNYKISIAIECLSIDKNYYTKEDLNLMFDIINFLNNLPDKGKFEMVKVFLGKEKEKYICPNGHINDIDNVFCAECNSNIKGLTKLDIEKIENFVFKVKALEHLF